MGHNSNWPTGIYRMSPPYVYSWNGRRHTCLLHICHYDYCNSHRCKSLQLTGYSSRRIYQMRDPIIMGLGLYFLIHSRWPNRNCPCQLLFRHRPTRHVLCSSPLPLCSVYRSCICYRCCLRPLIPSILRLHPAQYLNKNSLWNHVRWCKLNLLPATFPWFSRNTSTILRLPRRLHPMKYYFLYWLSNLPRSRNHVLIYYLRSIRR